MSKDNLRRLLFGTVAEISYGLESTDKVFEISEMLSDRRNLNFVLYFNHISYNDPLLAAWMVEQIDKDHSRHLLAPISYSHTDINRRGSKLFIGASKLASNLGIESVRVVQNYQIDNPKYGYSQEQANQSYRDWLIVLARAERPVGCLISPEGHRSDDGQLGQGERGIVNTGANLTPVLYIPMGIVYDGNHSRNGFNIGRRVNLNLGEVLVQEEKRARVDLNHLMLNLANTLPEEMRGNYR